MSLLNAMGVSKIGLIRFINKKVKNTSAALFHGMLLFFCVLTGKCLICQKCVLTVCFGAP